MDDGETWRLRLAASPVDGKANGALTRWIAKALDVKQSSIEITGGEKSRNKQVLVSGLPADEAIARLEELARYST